MEAGGGDTHDDRSVGTEAFLQCTPLALNVHFTQKMHLLQDNWKNDVVVQLRNSLHCIVWLLSGTLEHLAWNFKCKASYNNYIHNYFQSYLFGTYTFHFLWQSVDLRLLVMLLSSLLYTVSIHSQICKFHEQLL